MTGPTRIRSVGKAVQILLFLADDNEGATARVVSDALGMPVTTTHHLLGTLQADGMLAKDAQRGFHLGPSVGALVDAFQRRPGPPEYLLAPLRDLAARTGETAYLSGWQHDEAVVLATVEGSHAVHVRGLHTGFTGFTHARASGKVFLAFAGGDQLARSLARGPLDAHTPNTIVDPAALRRELRLTARRGYAIDHEEFTLGVCGVSAPVLDGALVVAAYTVAAPTARFQRGRADLIEAVRSAAAAAGSASGAATA